MNELAFEQVNEGNKNVFMNELGILHKYLRTRGGAVGSGTALQAGRSRVRFPMLSWEIFSLT